MPVQPDFGFFQQLMNLWIMQMSIELFVWFFPAEVILLGSKYGSISQALAVISGHDQLHTMKKTLDETVLLIIEVLANAFLYIYGASFEFDHAQGYAIYIEDDVGPLGMHAFDAHFLGYGKVIFEGILPVDQPYRLLLLSFGGFYLDPIAQKLIDVLVYGI